MGSNWWYKEEKAGPITIRDIKKSPYVGGSLNNTYPLAKARYLASIHKNHNYKNRVPTASDNAYTDDENSSGPYFKYNLLKIPPNLITDTIFLRDGVFDFYNTQYPDDVETSNLDYCKAGVQLSTDEGKSEGLKSKLCVQL